MEYITEYVNQESSFESKHITGGYMKYLSIKVGKDLIN